VPTSGTGEAATEAEHHDILTLYYFLWYGRYMVGTINK
jgi:hypothetical protein